MFPQPRHETHGSLRRLLPSAGFLVASMLWSTTVWSQPGPRILHDGLNCILAGEHVILEALVEPPDELITIKAYFRADVYSLYYYVQMTRVGDVYQAVLPKPSPEIPGVIYYLEAVDSAFNSARTEEFHPQVVVDSSSCRESNPIPPAYFDGPANITVGATGEGAAFPPGFLTEGIISTITAAGRVAASGGGGVGTAVALAAAGGAAVGVGVLVTGGGDDTTTTSVISGGGTSSVTTTTAAATTTSSPPGSLVVACFDTSPDPPTIPVGGTVRFDASCTEPDRDSIASYGWRFNDGRGDREGRVVNRVYNDEGVFSAELTVTTLDGATDRMSRDVHVEATVAPPPSGGGTPGPPTTADVEVLMTGPSNTPINGTATYIITVRNNGPLTANSVSFNHSLSGAINLPTYTGLVSGGFSTCTFTPPNASCSNATLAPGAFFQITVSIQVTGGPVTSSASASSASPPDSVANNSRTIVTSVPLRAPSEDGERLRTRFTSSLDVPPGDGRSRGRVTINGDRTDVTDSSAPTTHDVLARSDDNVVEGVLVRNVSDGRWRFDFSRAPHFEAGSLEIDEGQVLARTPDEVVFRVGRDARRVRFRFRLRR